MSSTPNVSLAVLRTLHRIHRQLTDLREQEARGPKHIRATEANVAYREQELARVRDEAKAMRVAVDQKQLQLKAGEQKIKDHRFKLNAAASNREYQILKEQIAADEMTNSVLEDEIIEALEKIDQFQAELTAAEAALAAGRQKAQEVHREVESRQPLIQGDLRRLEKDLKECEATLPPTVREVYTRVVRQKGEEALAEVEVSDATHGEGFCGGCHTQVPLNVQAEIRMSHPSFCKTCGRLLYFSEEAVPGA